MDFKIGDSIEEQTQEVVRARVKKQRTKAIVTVVILTVVFGLSAFFISGLIFNKKEPTAPPQEQLSFEDETVQILYNVITHGNMMQRDDIFVKNNYVTMDTFTDEEKLYYSLQYADSDDLQVSSTLNDSENKIYLLSDSSIKKYMRYFFGDSVKYSNVESMTYTFDFTVNDKNVAELKYNNRNGYDIEFKEYKNPNMMEPVQEMAITQPVSAKKEQDGSIIIEEKVLYVRITPLENNTFKYEIFKDYEKEIPLEVKNNLTEEEVRNYQVDFDSLSNVITIQYVFGVNSTSYYFKSSTMKK